MCANRQIMNIVARIEQIKSRSGVTLDRLLRQAGIGYGRFMRWKRRIVAGDLPVKSPGPKKVERFDFDELTEKVDRLCHGKKRTQGPGELYESYKRVISRREFNQMVNPLRRDRQRDRVPLYVRSAGSGPTSSGPLTVPCIRPNLPTKIRMFRIFRILCSVYKFTPHTTAYMPCGEEIAGHLDYQFSHYDPPLFKKRNNGGNLNHAVVNDLLEELMVIPINSPVKTAPYKGVVENDRAK